MHKTYSNLKGFLYSKFNADCCSSFYSSIYGNGYSYFPGFGDGDGFYSEYGCGAGYGYGNERGDNKLNLEDILLEESNA
jgi:hypothetical protein